MNIFISWSGNTSHKIACILRDWLPTVIHYIEPWVSSEDIKKGDRWSLELSKRLEEIHFGIICIDPSNVDSPWLNFEAGALSKSLEHGRVLPVLFGITPAELRGPLAQFQVTSFEKEDFYRLIRSINLTLASSRIDPERLFRSFEIAWPGLLDTINNIQLPSRQIPQSRENTKADQVPTDSLKSRKFKIFYVDSHAENAVSIKKTIELAGGSVELEQVNSAPSISGRNRTKIFYTGTIYYQFTSLLEAAVGAKNIFSKFGTKRIELYDWYDNHYWGNVFELVLYLGDDPAGL